MNHKKLLVGMAISVSLFGANPNTQTEFASAWQKSKQEWSQKGKLYGGVALAAVAFYNVFHIYQDAHLLRRCIDAKLTNLVYGGVRSWIRQLKPDRFIIAALALTASYQLLASYNAGENQKK